MKLFLIINLITFTALISACHIISGDKNGLSTKEPVSEAKIATPDFNADSAYQYIAKQVAFGPRVPNTNAHEQCANYLADKLKEFGAEVIVQEANVKAFNNQVLNAKNIIGSYNTTQNDRVLLFAHWDSRPFADNDPDPARRNQPISGANDGASGVGVLLEIARQMGKANPAIGVDIIFFDAEDYGMPDHIQATYVPDSWCLGSQHWAQNPHKPGYYAKFGILLDMVGAAGATFHQELYSLQFAPQEVKKIWNTASKLGYGNYFLFHRGGMITDDHVYVNKHLNIPCVNIIQYDPSTETSFGSFWHTHDDTMENIDRQTLKAVGQTVLHVVYQE